MKNIFVALAILTCVSCFSVTDVKAQIIDGAYERTDVKEKEPMSLTYVREADVMWSKKVWRIIDLREKMNQVFYFPTEETDGRNSLINVLLEGIENQTITAYDARLDDEFKVPMEYEQVKEAFGATTKVERVRNIDTGEFEEVTVVGEIRSTEVLQYMVKEEWYFDKKNSTMNVRILGICPIREYYRDEDIAQENPIRTQLFWVYFPEYETRKLLTNSTVINSDNTAQDLSFDDMLIKRKFNSYVVRESNVYNNRSISQYLSGRDALVESDRIETEIFNYEQDLWEY